MIYADEISKIIKGVVSVFVPRLVSVNGPNRKPSGLAKRRGKQSVDSEEEEEEDEDEMEAD